MMNPGMLVQSARSSRVAVAAASGVFTADFSSNANPLSATVWRLGATHGEDWLDPQALGGRALAVTQSGLSGSRYNDSIALVQTSQKVFANNQYAKATVYRVPGYTGTGGSHEIELALRGHIDPSVPAITPAQATFYEWLLGINSAGGYIALVRWNGNRGDYTPIFDPGSNSITALVSGDVIEAGIVGTTTYVKKNGSQLVTPVDVSTAGTVHTTGQPGLGFWPVDGATPANYGWATYEAGDL